MRKSGKIKLISSQRNENELEMVIFVVGLGFVAQANNKISPYLT
jgi:hypothetical protein